LRTPSSIHLNLRFTERVVLSRAVKSGDVLNQTGLAALLRGHDAVRSSVLFAASDPAKLIAAVRASGVKRYLVVGDAGS
jgi:putative NADH-flavin reductase